jgi:phosphatidylglycerol:prolipoprotein diacylglycerol transferase
VEAAVANTWLYPVLAIVGILLSSLIWNRLLRRKPEARDPRLVYIYLAALGGAFLGAKAAYLFAEGWMHWPDYAEHPALVWRQWLTGKSITGALLGGYGAVELVKHLTGYNKATGDLFAVIAPLGLALGRVGCFASGCCLGRPMAPAWYTLADRSGMERWPAVPLEFAFNLVMAGFALACSRLGRFQGQLFHLYLMFYGIFRFAHECFRDTPRLVGGLSGYHLLAMGILLLGLVRYVQRARVPTSNLV